MDSAGDAFFQASGRTVFSAAAPARLDVMGGVSDYSGALVLEYPLRESTTAHIALRNDRVFRVVSTNVPSTGSSKEVAIRLPKRFSYPGLARMFDAQTRWAAYVIGCAAVLIKELDLDLSGADIMIESDVPSGRGVSASAALEVAVMTALCRALGATPGDTELPALCQLAENNVALAPCGVMDQTVSYLGRQGTLLPIVCQPQLVDIPIRIPEGIRFVGIDSGVTHNVGGSPYADARAAAFMGYEIIRRHIGRRLPFGGFLANIPALEFEDQFAPILPGRVTGRTFLKKYDGTVDPVSTVRESKSYDVRTATSHPIHEHRRSSHFRNHLEALNGNYHSVAERNERLRALGELMYESHNAYSAIGLGHSETDLLVNSARKAGPEAGIYGARVTGGGSGGTVCLLVDGSKGLLAASALAKRCTGSTKLYIDSSDGARWREPLPPRRT